MTVIEPDHPSLSDSVGYATWTGQDWLIEVPGRDQYRSPTFVEALHTESHRQPELHWELAMGEETDYDLVLYRHHRGESGAESTEAAKHLSELRSRMKLAGMPEIDRQAVPDSDVRTPRQGGSEA